MPEPIAPAATPAAEPSISDLRAMFNAPAPEAAPLSEKATPAPAASDDVAGKTPAPAPDPAQADGEAGKRDAAGRFKPADKPAGEEAPPEDAVTPNVQKRIDKAIARQRAAERERDELKASIQQQQAKPGSQPAQNTVPPAAGKPDPAKFATYEEYNEALVDWKVDQKTAQLAQRGEAARRASSFNERVATAKKAHADYDEVLAEAASMPISPVMHDFIVESEHGPELGYYFGSNPEEAARIFALPPIAQTRAIVALEAQLAPKAEPATPAASPTPTKTPAAAAPKPLPRPAAAVGGSHAPATVDLNDPALSMRDFKRHVAKLLAE